MDKLPIYEIAIDLEDSETGVEMNAFVERPAHEKNFQYFSEQKFKRYYFDDEQQVVTGVAIFADLPIYRRDPELGEHYVVFTKDNITKIVEQYSRDGNFNKVNLDHDSEKQLDGVYMTTSYQVSNELGFTAPERFKDVSNGSWIMSYKVQDKATFEEIKSKRNGFSVEGVFIQKLMKSQEQEVQETPLDKLIEVLKGITNEG